MRRLLEIFGSKIKLNITEYSPEYYYFYDNNNEVFGISKSITEKEYELLKLTYQEKDIYNVSVDKQKIFEYLFENGNYPFNGQTRFFVHESNQDDHIIEELIAEVYSYTSIKFKNLVVYFIYDNHDISIKELFQTLSGDIQDDIFVHVGPFMQRMSGVDFVTYLECYRNSNIRTKKNSTVVDLILETHLDCYNDFLKVLNILLLDPIKEHIDLVKVLFRNDLNVLKTSKELYINRNSVLFRIESIENKIGINIQKFKGACAIKILLANNNLF